MNFDVNLPVVLFTSPLLRLLSLTWPMLRNDDLTFLYTYGVCIESTSSISALRLSTLSSVFVRRAAAKLGAFFVRCMTLLLHRPVVHVPGKSNADMRLHGSLVRSGCGYGYAN